MVSTIKYNAKKRTYTGTNENDVLDATTLDYVVPQSGKNKNKGLTIKGGKGDDEITGTTGKDTITGGVGSNVVNYTKGDGNDTIYLTKGENFTLNMNNLTFNDLRFEYANKNKDLRIYTSKTSDEEYITLKNFAKKDVTNNSNAKKGIADTSSVEIVVGGKTYDLRTSKNLTDNEDVVLYKTTLGENAKNFTGTWLNDEIDASGVTLYKKVKDGKKKVTVEKEFKDTGLTLKGGVGNDSVTGTKYSDKIYGNKGNDTINAGTGNNYIYFNKGDGHDIIENGNGVDTLVFAKKTKLSYSYDKYDLIIKYSDKDTVTLKDYLKGHSVQYVQIGTKKTVFNPPQPTVEEYQEDGYTVFNGSEIADTITGTNDKDKIYGNDGNDIITSGVGSDIIDGGKGNNIYTFSNGDGNDVIYLQGDNDTIIFNKFNYVIKDEFACNLNGNSITITRISTNKNNAEITDSVTIYNTDNHTVKVQLPDGTLYDLNNASFSLDTSKVRFSDLTFVHDYKEYETPENGHRIEQKLVIYDKLGRKCERENFSLVFPQTNDNALLALDDNNQPKLYDLTKDAKIIINQLYGGKFNEIITCDYDANNIIVQAREGSDEIYINENGIVKHIYGDNSSTGTGNDYIMVAGTVKDSIKGYDGDDEIIITEHGCADKIYGNEGADSITIKGEIYSSISGDNGDDTIRISKLGRIYGNITGGSGNDTFIVESGTKIAKISDVSNIDKIIFENVKFSDLAFRTNNQWLLIYDTNNPDSGCLLNYNTSSNPLDMIIALNENGIYEEYSLQEYSYRIKVMLPSINGTENDDYLVADFHSHITGNNGNDTIIVNGYVSGAVNGGDGNDVIEIKGRAGTIYGYNDNDNIVVTGFAGAIYAGEGADEIIISERGYAGSIDGDNGNDTIVNSGYISGDISGGMGDDSITTTEYSKCRLIRFKAEDGNDTVYLGGEKDILYFDAQDMTYSWSNDLNDIIIRYNNNEDSVTVKNYSETSTSIYVTTSLNGEVLLSTKIPEKPNTLSLSLGASNTNINNINFQIASFTSQRGSDISVEYNNPDTTDVTTLIAEYTTNDLGM